MTVSELIEQLSNLAPDLEVCIDSACGEYGYQSIHVLGFKSTSRFSPGNLIVLTNNDMDSMLRCLWMAPK